MSDHDDRGVKLPRVPRAGATPTPAPTPAPKEEAPAEAGDLLLDMEDIEIELDAEGTQPPALTPAAPPVRRSLFGDLALGDDEIDGIFGAMVETRAEGAPPSLDAVALVEPELSSEVVRVVEEPPAAEFAVDEELEVVVEEPEEQSLLEVEEGFEESDEADLTIEADEDFVEVEAPAELDRGAALAAAVTSR